MWPFAENLNSIRIKIWAKKHSSNRRHSTCSHRWFDVMQSQVKCPTHATFTHRAHNIENKREQNKTKHKNCLCAFALAMINNININQRLYNGTRRCCMPPYPNETLCVRTENGEICLKIIWNTLAIRFIFSSCDRRRRRCHNHHHHHRICCCFCCYYVCDSRRRAMLLHKTNWNGVFLQQKRAETSSNM